MARFTGFVDKLTSSPCREVRVMAALVTRDARTVTGSNVGLIEEESGLQVGKTTVQQFIIGLAASRKDVPAADVWRIPFLKK